MVDCQECGTVNRPDAQFCTNCDAYLGWVPEASPEGTRGTEHQQQPSDKDKPEDRGPTTVPSPMTDSVRSRRPDEQRPGGSGPRSEKVAEPSSPEAAPRVQPEDPAEPRPATTHRIDPATAQPVHAPASRSPGQNEASPVTRRPGRVGNDGKVSGRTMTPGEFRRAMRAANGGRRAAYDRRLSARTRSVRIGAATTVAALLFAFFGPFGGALRSVVSGGTTRLLGRYEPVEVSNVSAATAEGPAGQDPQIPGFLLSYAADGYDTTAWATTWDPDSASEVDECSGAPAAGTTLTLEFAEPTNVDRIRVLPGISRDKEQWRRQFRPRTVDVRFSGGACERLRLNDRFELQEYGVEVEAADSATVMIVDAFEPEQGNQQLVAISEIAFDRG